MIYSTRMVKYKQALEDVMAANKAEFDEFSKIHDLYKIDSEKHQQEFNLIGKHIQRLLEEAENRLCGKMEGAGKGNYSAGLAEKFRQEVRKVFPLVDMIGMTIS